MEKGTIPNTLNSDAMRAIYMATLRVGKVLRLPVGNWKVLKFPSYIGVPRFPVV